MTTYQINLNISIPSEKIESLQDKELRNLHQVLNSVNNAVSKFSEIIGLKTTSIGKEIEQVVYSEMSRRDMPHGSESLSDKQKVIMRYIQNYIYNHGVSPTIAEIRDDAMISSSSVVHWNIKKLERMGYVTRTPKQARSLNILIPII